jgi:hypothetical protein
LQHSRTTFNNRKNTIFFLQQKSAKNDTQALPVSQKTKANVFGRDEENLRKERMSAQLAKAVEDH